jgi:predicted membrane protein
MDSGQLVYIISRLSLCALAAFLAILLWSKTRDLAWMFMVIAAIAVYVDTVYSILVLFGIAGRSLLSIGSMSVFSIIFPCLPTVFFIAAFTVMVIRKYFHRQNKNVREER